MLAIAHGFQTFGHLAPCHLCLKQREVYWAAMAVSAVAIVAGLTPLRAPSARGSAALVLALVFAYGAYLAGFHAGAEWNWWPAPVTCASTGPVNLSALKALLAGGGAHQPACDQAPWVFLGLSMAGWNFVASVGLVLAQPGRRRCARKRPPHEPSAPARPGVGAAKARLDEMLRVDHAGELAAGAIYRGQRAVLRASRTAGRTLAEIADMEAQEDEHLARFDAILIERRVRPSLLAPLWRAAGFGLGAATALIGESAAHACTEAVETRDRGPLRRPDRRDRERRAGAGRRADRASATTSWPTATSPSPAGAHDAPGLSAADRRDPRRLPRGDPHRREGLSAWTPKPSAATPRRRSRPARPTSTRSCRP